MKAERSFFFGLYLPKIAPPKFVFRFFTHLLVPGETKGTETPPPDLLFVPPFFFFSLFFGFSLAWP